MACDGRVLRRAINRLEQQRQQHEALQAARKEEAYRRIPRIAAIDAELRGSIIGIIEASLKSGSDPVPAISVLRDKNLDLQAERAELLSSHGYPIHFLDVGPLCRKCGDTGYQGPEMCSCLKKLYQEEQIKELSNLLNLGSQSFGSFDYELYSEMPWPGMGISPRKNMESVYEICLDYAVYFGKYEINNLFLCGGTGLGKTFLSACIARDVSSRGYSVVYDTAVNVFARFEEQKFSRDLDDSRDARDETRRYLACDLLILDDLGTEMGTAFTQSALYQLINSRLVSGRRTIISTNLREQDLQQRYTPQIASRILGEYRKLPFFGEDIRMIKKNKQLI
jgi:DNA replication protein DnaC